MKALVVDDEFRARGVIIGMLAEFCADVIVVGEAESAAGARALIEKLQPDLVFVDIEMPDENGIDFVNSYPQRTRNFEVIYVTGHEHYARQAVGCGAVGFLVKVVDMDELIDLVEKVRICLKEKEETQYQKNLPQSEPSKKKFLEVTTRDGIKRIPEDAIIYCQAATNYIEIICTGTTKIELLCGNMKRHQEKLWELGLLRVHKSYIINARHIQQYYKDPSGDTGGKVLMSNGEVIPISKSHKDEFKVWMNK